MEIIRQQDIQIDDLVAALKRGKTIVYPTETCYGLGCDATNKDAVQKIFEIKRRQKDKPVLVVVSDIDMMMSFVDCDPTIMSIAKKYWPGPLTVVAPIRLGIEFPEGVVGADGTIAFRVTDHPLAAALSEGADRPIVSTSANIASEESPYDIESVLRMFAHAEHQPDIVVDAGTLPHRSPSTIVRVMHGGVEVLRQGEVVVDL